MAVFSAVKGDISLRYSCWVHLRHIFDILYCLSTVWKSCSTDLDISRQESKIFKEGTKHWLEKYKKRDSEFHLLDTNINIVELEYTVYNLSQLGNLLVRVHNFSIYVYFCVGVYSFEVCSNLRWIKVLRFFLIYLCARTCKNVICIDQLFWSIFLQLH